MKHSKMLIICIIFKGSIAYAKSSEENNCYQINELQIQGARHLSKLELKQLSEKYKNHCINIEDIKGLIREITNIYVKKGYITSRAGIPPQNLQEGKLIVKVQEGYISSIEFADGKKIKSNSLVILEDQILNLRDIEQAIDNINLLKSNNANVYLKPGTKPGSSVVVVDNKASKRWHISSGIDNAGSKSKGYNQSFSSISFEDILGWGEYYTFGYRSSLTSNDKFMRSYSGTIVMPHGYNSFTVSYNDAVYKNLIRATRNQYVSRGGSRVGRAGVSRVIHRDNSSKTSISFGIGIDDYKNYIADNKIEMSTYRLDKFDLGLQHQRRLEASVIGFGLQASLGENQGYKASLGHIKLPGKRFSKINANMFWFKPLPIKEQKVKYSLQINGQFAPNLLVVTEKNSVGGLTSVRGYKDHIENADSTLIIRNELILDIPIWENKKLKKLLGDTSVFGAFDLGMFRNHEERGYRTGTLSGIATGIRNSKGYINYGMTIGRALKQLPMMKQFTTIYFNISVDV